MERTALSMKLNHNNVSYVKSALRIIAGFALVIGGSFISNGWVIGAGMLLIAAEALGILEELV